MNTRCVLKDRLWEWGNEGVEIHDTHLTWFEKEGATRFASGAACDQSFDDVENTIGSNRPACSRRPPRLGVAYETFAP